MVLKVLKGAGAGNEVALSVGVTTFGSDPECDVVFTDVTLGAHAFSVEVSEDGMLLRSPSDADGKVLEPYTVFSFGEMEFAVGESDVQWPELKRHSHDSVDIGSPKAETVGEERRNSTRWGLVSFLAALIVLASGFGVGVIWYRQDGAFDLEYWRHTENWLHPAEWLSAAESWLHRMSGEGAGACRMSAPSGLIDVAGASGGGEDDIDNRIRNGCEVTMRMLTNGRLVVEAVSNRVVRLGGVVGASEELTRAVRAAMSDVRGIERVDTAGVGLRRAPALMSSGSNVTSPLSPESATPVGSGARRHSSNPLVGGMTAVLEGSYPYVLTPNGRRMSVGAEVGGWRLKDISATAVILERDGKELKWLP